MKLKTFNIFSDGEKPRMKTRNEVHEIIRDCFNEFNLLLPEKSHLHCHEQTIVAGKNSSLDSLMTLNLMINLEEKMREKANISFSALDLLAKSTTNTISVETLLDFICTGQNS